MAPSIARCSALHCMPLFADVAQSSFLIARRQRLHTTITMTSGAWRKQEIYFRLSCLFFVSVPRASIRMAGRVSCIGLRPRPPLAPDDIHPRTGISWDRWLDTAGCVPAATAISSPANKLDVDLPTYSISLDPYLALPCWPCHPMSPHPLVIRCG